MTQLLRDQSALVTGAGRGIGRGIATALAAHGCTVTINDIDEGAATEAASDIASTYDVATNTAVGDVSDPDDADYLVREASKGPGGLDILVNNAAIIVPQSYEEIDDASWEQVLDVNISGVHNCTAAAYDELKGGGRIVNIASTAGLRISLLAGAHYTTSKWGVVGYTKHVAYEGAAHDIRANAVCPGPTETDRIRSLTDADEREAYADNDVPLGRWGSPEDVGNATVFLASGLSSFVTGVTLPVDGGFTIL